MCDLKAWELAFTDLESAFFLVEAHAIFAYFSEYLFLVYRVLGYAMGFSDHVIDVDLKISFNLLFEDLIHQSLVCSACILQAKRHDHVAEVGIFSNKFCFLFIWGVHPDLTVS